jgi:phage/plasmid-like protein (TIGR03299 family)
MAHLIDRMAFTGETPWHGLGAVMQPDEPLDIWRIRAGLGWEAKASPVRFACERTDADGNALREAKTFDGMNVIYRGDTGMPLSTVSDGYNIVQPRDVIEFYRDLTDSHGFKMETAGSLKGGRTIWALAKADTDAMRISGVDVIGGYLLLSTSFDGSSSTTGRFTTVRVVCNNTLTAANNNGKAPVNVSHRAMFNADAAKITLKVGDAFTKFQEDAQRMAETGVSKEQAVEFFLKVFHNMTPSEVNDDNRAKIEKTMARLGRHFTAGPGAELRSAKGTAWGLLNAVTFDLDHVCRAHSDENRFASAQFGRGETIKERARDLALALAA